MAKLKLPNGKMIKVEDGLSEAQMDEVVEDAMRSDSSQAASKPVTENPEPSFPEKRSLFTDLMETSSGGQPQKTPVSMIDRFKMSFGNQAGNKEYLQNKGFNTSEVDGELMANGAPVDPDSARGLFNLTVPGQIYRKISGDKTSGLGDIAQMSQDIPYEASELPAKALNMIPFGGTKAKQGIGSLLGTYKDPGEGYFNKEAVNNAIMDAVSLLMPGIGKGVYKSEEAISRPIKKKIIESELPERLYANATGLADTLVDEPDIVRTLLKNKVSGNLKDLRNVSKSAQKTIGQKMDQTLADKTFSPEELGALPSSEDIANKYAASGQIENAKNIANKVYNEFKNKFFNKKISEVETGFVKSPSYEDFKRDMLSKYKNKSSSAYVSDSEPADLEDLIEYGLKKNTNIVDPPVRLTRSAGGYDINALPRGMYSETRKVGRSVPLGKDLPSNFFPEKVPSRSIVPDKISLLKSENYLPNITEENIQMLYKQAYPDEWISLPKKKIEKSLPKLLKDLNRQKIIDSKAAKRLYETEGALGLPRQHAQKSLADRSRDFIEAKSPEMRPLNRDYHVYDELERGIEKAMGKDYAKAPLIRGGRADSLFGLLKNKASDMVLGGNTKGQTKRAVSLFDFANSPEVASQLSSNPNLLPVLLNQYLKEKQYANERNR